MKRTSLQAKIPKDILERLLDDPFMTHCIVGGGCAGRTQFHHAFTYQGRRTSDIWAILPLCVRHHKEMTRSTQTICRMALRARISHFKAMDDFKTKYPRSDLFK